MVGVRHVTGTGSGLLGGIPRVVVQISALTLKGPQTELIIITILHIIIITTSILNLGFQNIWAKNIGTYNMHK